MIDGPNEYAYVRQNPWTKFDPEVLDGPFVDEAPYLITTTNYNYNELDQVTSANIGGTIIASFTYDADGNRSTETEGSVTNSYSYDAENRLTNLVQNTGSTGNGGPQIQHQIKNLPNGQPINKVNIK